MEFASLNALISEGKDCRQFRRFTTRRDAGVRPVGVGFSRDGASASLDPGAGASYHSAIVRDLSMTGLYLVSKLPYRVGLRLEAQIPLPTGLITVIGTVQRLQALRHPQGHDDRAAYGCGIQFIQSLMNTPVRRELMCFLLHLAPSELYTLPHHLMPVPHPPVSHCSA